MSSSRPRSYLLPLLLILAIVLASCTPPTPSQWDSVQQTSTAGGQATAEEALPGSAFNKFFPESGDGFDVVYTQEKQGFVEAVLKQDGQDLATFAIFDTASDPSVAQKYGSSSQKVSGFPAADIGSLGTAILVANRFQVQIRSKSDDFDVTDRILWLSKFDLAGLMQLK